MPNPRERPRKETPVRDKPREDGFRDWYVSIPFSELYKLQHELDFMDEMKQENAQLRREMDGMRNMFSELQTAFGELRRELRGR